MTPAYYNEHDPFAAAWLRNLTAADLIAAGTVDERSIADVRAADLVGHDRCHFFAGIGGWDHALRLAGWPERRAVWTGSCPCQPFSVAGKRKGKDDERHLWPVWFTLIAERAPDIVFGEQVSSPDGLRWFDAVRDDLEGAGYAVGVLDTCAAGIGAPHLRQRLYFVAVAHGGSRDLHLSGGGKRREVPDTPRSGSAEFVAEPNERARGQGRAVGGRGDHRGVAEPRPGPRGGSVADAGRLGDADEPRREGRCERRDGADQRSLGTPVLGEFWRDAEWLPCRDGKLRPAQRDIRPLAHGISRRVGPSGAVETQPRAGQLKGYGNAIVPQQAAAFVRAFMAARPDLCR